MTAFLIGNNHEPSTIGARPRDYCDGSSLNPSTVTPSNFITTSTAIHTSNSTSKLPCVNQSDSMMLDDTKHTTYIHDLDRELADIDSAERGLVILPLATKLISLPDSVLSTPAQSKDLVLYTEPSSLTVPKERDSVRKAIIESRARARAKAQAASGHQSPSRSDNGVLPQPPSKDFWDTSLTYSVDDDPMDIDSNP